MVITYETESTAYKNKKALYVNATNRCNNRCVFCHRFNREQESSRMDELWLEREPTVEEILDDIRARDMAKYDEVVFCGYGEPACRLKDILEVARVLKQEYGVAVRLNTNGLADTLYGEDVTPWLDGLVDVVSVSLNAPDAQAYDALCRPQAEDAFEHLLRFSKNAARFAKVYMTIIDTMSAEDQARCREIAEKVGAELKVRHYLP